MKSGTRTKLVQKIYEKTKNPDGVIDFGKDPYIRHIKKYLKDILNKKNSLMKF